MHDEVLIIRGKVRSIKLSAGDNNISKTIFDPSKEITGEAPNRIQYFTENMVFYECLKSAWELLEGCLPQISCLCGSHLGVIGIEICFWFVLEENLN